MTIGRARPHFFRPRALSPADVQTFPAVDDVVLQGRLRGPSVRLLCYFTKTRLPSRHSCRVHTINLTLRKREPGTLLRAHRVPDTGKVVLFCFGAGFHLFNEHSCINTHRDLNKRNKKRRLHNEIKSETG